MALVTTMSTVFGVLAAMAVLLWFSAFVEARQLGPVQPAVSEPERPTMSPAAGGATVQPIRTAA